MKTGRHSIPGAFYKEISLFKCNERLEESCAEEGLQSHLEFTLHCNGLPRRSEKKYEPAVQNQIKKSKNYPIYKNRLSL